MIERCTNPNADNYEYYGGRGILVCDRWFDFENFLEDMGSRPDGKTLDRKDCNGNYCLENCRWATLDEQRNNTNATRRLVFDGAEYSLSQLSRKAGLKLCTLWYRLDKGWSVERAVTAPVGRWA
jgi:hypothetical protein